MIERPSPHWTQLQPDPSLLAALDAADVACAYETVAAQDQQAKKNWSNRFADQCARMVAKELRAHSTFAKLTVLPDDGTRNEIPMFVSGDKRKRIDVVAASLVSGLQVGISLKGMNFRDDQSKNFDKNLTGRTYEFQDEVRVVHGHQPKAFMVGLYFMPLAATSDKTKGASSFAHSVSHLRSLTGRLDPSLQSQLGFADMCAIALYVPISMDVKSAPPPSKRIRRGVVRYFDVKTDPPYRGRPEVGTTFDLAGIVDLIARRYSTGGKPEDEIDWAQPEPDDAADPP